jgi:hypothetical protein
MSATPSMQRATTWANLGSANASESTTSNFEISCTFDGLPSQWHMGDTTPHIHSHSE